jgi:hypothetical protein
MGLGNILDRVLAIRIKENKFWWDPPPEFPINSSGGLPHIQVTLLTNELPCSYITVTLYNILVTLLDRVTALWEPGPRTPAAAPPARASHRRLATGYLDPTKLMSKVVIH